MRTTETVEINKVKLNPNCAKDFVDHFKRYYAKDWFERIDFNPRCISWFKMGWEKARKRFESNTQLEQSQK